MLVGLTRTLTIPIIPTISSTFPVNMCLTTRSITCTIYYLSDLLPYNIHYHSSQHVPHPSLLQGRGRLQQSHTLLPHRAAVLSLTNLLRTTRQSWWISERSAPGNAATTQPPRAHPHHSCYLLNYLPLLHRVSLFCLQVLHRTRFAMRDESGSQTNRRGFLALDEGFR